MPFEIKEVLSSVGPAASLIFAGWIFLQLLNQRYTSSFDRYRALVTDYRDIEDKDLEHNQRHKSIREQVLLYKRRCEQMRASMNIGLAAAMLLILGLALGALRVAFTQLTFLDPLSLFCLVVGLLLVIAATTIVLRENIEIKKAIDSEISDIDDLKDAAR
jgi:uncharacterized membrane protein YcjF (UPF0283 family)